MTEGRTGCSPREETRALLEGGAWFRDLPDALRDFLLDAGHVATLAPGGVLFVRGAAPDGLYAMLRGRVHVRGYGVSGREALLAVVEAPQWFGELSLFDERPRTHDAVADVPSRVLHVPLDALRDHLDRHPDHWCALGRLLAQKLRHAFGAIEEAALLPPLGRVARRLVVLAEGFGALAGTTHRSIDVSQEQLGAMLSLSRQTVNRLLGRLAETGTIRLARGGVEITDLDALRRVANES